MPAATRSAAAAAYRRRSPARRVTAALRDTWVLVREFRDGLILFAAILLIGALSFRLLWNASQPEPLRFLEALFAMLTMIFLQPTLDFPEQWYLDLYFFVMPVLGIIALARGLSDFAALLFNRRSRQNEWEVAVISTMRDHIIVAGVGHLGIRVVRELVLTDEDVVVIEQKAESSRLDEVRSYDIPVLVGDARSPEVLRRAGIEQASALIVCTNDDLINLQIASRVREIDANIRIVMRMFDDEFARFIAERFGIAAVMSASGMAAPAFAGAATGTEITQTFKVGDQVLAMGRIDVQRGSRLDGATIGEVERSTDASIVLLRSDSGVDLRPPPDALLHAGDEIAVVAALPQIKLLASRWNRANFLHG